MARTIESNLYQTLIDTQFSFVARGERTIDEIYNAVKSQLPDLCDDGYSCSDNCKHGNKQPEWNHIVRSALQRLKSACDSIDHSGNRGFWIFS